MFHDKISNSIFGATTQRSKPMNKSNKTNNKFKTVVSYVIANNNELTTDSEIENKIEEIIEHPELFDIYEDKNEFQNVLNEKQFEQPIELTNNYNIEQQQIKKKTNNSFFNIAKKEMIKSKYRKEFS